MPLNQSQARQLPFGLRLAGLWLIWSAWCSASGWLLSAVHQLGGPGHLILLPVLLGCCWVWLKSTAACPPSSTHPFRKIFRRLRQPAALIYLAIALLSLLSGCLYAPWDFDAMTYRLPRALYWWSAHHWYWIGTLDHRLDYSSTGFEWQMLPLMELTRNDRLIFLINWIPFVLMPGLVFAAFRAFAVNGRSARRWMWLLPSGYCFALQCSGLQNDAYAVNYVLAAVAFAGGAFRWRWRTGFWQAVLAAAALTGAKLSNILLWLPIGGLLWSAMRRISWLNWRLVAISLVAIFCSCAPLMFFAVKHTGDWSGDPDDQWQVRAHRPVGAMLTNLLMFFVDATQPPVFPGSEHLNRLLEPVNQSAVVHWLSQSHGDFKKIRYGTMVYGATVGPGFGLACYTLILLVGGLIFKTNAASRNLAVISLPWAWRLAPGLAWVAFAVCLAKLGSLQSPRICSPYVPLLLVTLLRSPRVAALERKKSFGALAGLAAATVIPVIMLTPARPLVPVQTIARHLHFSALAKAAADYATYEHMRDDLAPLRAQLPPDATCVGYAAGLSDSPYGLFPPFGQREIVELGLPLGSHSLPPPDLHFAVVTKRGLQERGQIDLEAWLDRVQGKIIFTFSRGAALDAHSAPIYEAWYLVKMNPPARRNE